MVATRTLSVSLLTCLLAFVPSASAQHTADSLAELRAFGTSVNNATVTLSATGGDPHPVTGVVTPGEYWINGDHIANPTSTHPRFLTLAGNGNTYDFSGATLNLDTRKLDGYGRGLGHDSGVDVVRIEGSNNLVQGLTLIGQDIALDTDPNAQRYADWSTVYVELSGSSNTVDGAHVIARGSRTDTYGLSDAFGKGASQGIQPFIGHRKASNFRVGEATNAVVNDIHLETYSFGHNFFVQGSTNTTLTNSTIKAELFPSQLVLDRSEYQQYGHTWWGEPIPDDIMLAGSEGGVRVYTGSSGLTVDNVVVDGARTGFATVHDGGQVNISNSYAYNTTSGFDVGDNTTITNSGGNIVNGPLLVFYGSGNNTTIDLELTEGTPIGTNWSAAYFNGNANISISSDLAAEDLPEESYVRLGQSFFENWRNFDYNTATPEDGSPTAFNNQTFANNTNQILVIGQNAEGNVGTSQGPVISNGKENHYDGVTLVPVGTLTVVSHSKGLGNSGTETGAAFSGGNVVYTGTATAQTLDDNATVVRSTGTLELAPGVRVTDEKLTISGDGVDGQGALYTDGQTGSGTRFGSSSGSDESTIFLDGNASIGVGVAGNQLLVGRIQGTGNLTKRGPGRLSIEKSSALAGNLTIAEGEVIARSGVVNHGLTVMAGASIGLLGHGGVNTTDTVFLFGAMDVNARSDDGPLSATVGPLFGAGTVGASNEAATQASTLTIDTPTGVGFFVGQIEANLNVVKTGTGSQVLSGTNTYAGTTTVSEGLLQVEGMHTGGGGYTVEQGGVLGGNGNIGSTVLVESGGVLAPGASAGELTIQSVELQSGATLEIELENSSEYDLLSVDDLILGGDLTVALIGSGFTPETSDVFTVAAAESLSGAFDNVANGARLDTLGGEGSFLVNYNAAFDTLTLSDFAVSGLAGDFNADGVVDAADYSVWRDGLGTTYTPADYDDWVANFGASESSNAASVPEPASGFATLIALCVCWRSRRYGTTI